ncbi:uncharacterized protein EAE97_004424 [Botrytis byssoidea]|uniref:Involucrin repeat protein n=1 Tax=Botrytis byssoidea TaxID=139641 RepID=A0A9P5IPY5_9HELO|nr:uncharacterized protein EAE97_004424 [Botrytis byssoidea]KAF7947175.1 hypothetical protein EAE97_004424 [Botrytis byssoidea]
MSAREKKHAPKYSSSRIDLAHSLAHRTASTSISISGSGSGSRSTNTNSQGGDYDSFPCTSTTSQSQSQSSLAETTAPPRARLSHSSLQSTTHSAADPQRSNRPIPTTHFHSHSRSRSRSRSNTPSPPSYDPYDEEDYPPHPHSSTSDEESESEEEEEEPLPPDSQIHNLTTTLLHTRETLHLLQTAHSTLHTNYLATDSQLRLLRSAHANCPSAAEVQSRVGALMLDRDAFREAYTDTMGEMRRKDEEIMALRGQVRGLKEWVSSSGRGGVGGEQVTDEVVAEKMQWIGNALQNWVISNFRRGRIDLEKGSHEARQQLEHWVPMYQRLATSSKINFIQSLVSTILVFDIFQAYFVGLPEQQAMEIARTEMTLGSYGPEDAMNQWRSTTLGILLKEAPEKLKSETTTVVNTVVAQLNSLLDPIFDVQSTEARDQSLKTIINAAINLSRLLRVQKAVFSIMMPIIEEHQQTKFDEERMEDIGGEDEDTLNEREISCVTFPGIMKAGDENGERNHLVNVVAKMKVLCAPD